MSHPTRVHARQVDPALLTALSTSTITTFYYKGCNNYIHSISPLTTTFTAPASCQSSLTPYLGSTGYYSELFVQNVDEGDCFPPRPTRQACTFVRELHYSPGFCPSGYTTTAMDLAGDDVTTATCCPTGYTFVSRGATDAFYNNQTMWFSQCYSMFNLDSTSGPSTSTMTLTYDYILTPDSSSPSVKPTVTTTVVTHGFVYRPPIYVSFTEGELASLTASRSRSQTSQSVPNTSTPTTSETSAAPAAPPSGAGLSTGAKAGIGVGGSVVVLLIFVVVAFAWRRRGGKEKGTTTGGGEEPGESVGLTQEWNKVELSAEGQGKAEMSGEGQGKAEMSGEGQGKAEMSGEVVVKPELDVGEGERVYYELQGDWRPGEMAS